MHYPECQKLSAIHDQSPAIGAFVECLHDEKDIHPGVYAHPNGETMSVGHVDAQALLAEIYNIDLARMEAEKQHLLVGLRQLRRFGRYEKSHSAWQMQCQSLQSSSKANSNRPTGCSGAAQKIDGAMLPQRKDTV